MDEAFAQLVANLPSAAAVIFTVYIMSYFEERREKRREENAKEKAREDREHEIKTGQMWASNITMIMQKMDATFHAISEKIEEHDEQEANRYEKMQITQDLVKMAKEYAERKR